MREITSTEPDVPAYRKLKYIFTAELMIAKTSPRKSARTVSADSLLKCSAWNEPLDGVFPIQKKDKDMFDLVGVVLLDAIRTFVCPATVNDIESRLLHSDSLSDSLSSVISSSY